MATIQKMLNRATKARNGIAIQMPQIIERNKKRILDLNRWDQLYRNLNSDGREIGRYKLSTEEIGNIEKLFKPNFIVKEFGKPFDFKQTGDFFKGFELDYGGSEGGSERGIDIFSTDPKTEILEKKYEKLFGLTPKNQLKLNYLILKPELAAYIKRTLNV